MNRRMAVASALGALTLAVGGYARAQESPVVRDDRRLLLAVAVPDFIAVYGQDETVPMPAGRLAVNFSPRFGADLTLSAPVGGFSQASAGMRLFLSEHRLSPYLLAHLGHFRKGEDSHGPARSVDYLAGGGGLEFAGFSGFTAWLEAGQALVRSDRTGGPQWGAGLYASAGIGFRLLTRSAPRQ
jgi:hypothetical protein